MLLFFLLKKSKSSSLLPRCTNEWVGAGACAAHEIQSIIFIILHACVLAKCISGSWVLYFFFSTKCIYAAVRLSLSLRPRAVRVFQFSDHQCVANDDDDGKPTQKKLLLFFFILRTHMLMLYHHNECARRVKGEYLIWTRESVFFFLFYIEGHDVQ